MRSRRRVAGLLLVITCSTTVAGCYRYRVYQIGGEPSTEWQSRTLHSLLWGAVLLPVSNCQLGNGQRLGIDEVKIEKNFAESLAVVATLGVWGPVTVSWRCNKPAPPSGTPGGTLP
jgi:hypothetical protein